MQTFHFSFYERPDWPVLAWVARIQEGDLAVSVFHGSRVELNNQWMCEAIWDGDFSNGEFDETDLIFGSGIRLRQGKIVFVSSGTTVDRIVYCELKSGTRFVSNSLVALAAVARTNIDITYRSYFEDFSTCGKGIDYCKRYIETSMPQINQVFFHNLVFDGKLMRVEPKPNSKRSFPNCESYNNFMIEAVVKIGSNLQDGKRKFPYSTIGTLSSGYDSTAVSVLGKLIGNTDVIVIEQARRGLDENGRELAAIMGLNPIIMKRMEWRNLPGAAIPFLAANANGSDMQFAAAAPYTMGKVLLTGHGGILLDSVPREMDREMYSVDTAGMSMTEPRLAMGFIHAAILFMGGRNRDQWFEITHSQAMAPWRLGGTYDRPICRRIVEDSGVPRDMFGMVKKGSNIVILDETENFLPDEALNSLYRWIAKNRVEWIKRRHIPPDFAVPLRGLKYRIERLIGRERPMPQPYEILYRYLFPWALEEAKKMYGDTTVLNQ